MPYGSTLHIPPTNCLLLAAKQESYQKKSISLRNTLKNFLERVQKKGAASRKRSDRKDNRTWQKNKRGDSKVESNDSPEIPNGGGETSDIPGLPSGAQR